MLLDAAAQLIAERGYRGAAVNDVIAQAGLSKGAFYWHFKAKDDLLFALIDERLDRPIRELIELLQSTPAEQDMAPEANERFLALIRQDPETLVLEHEYSSCPTTFSAKRWRSSTWVSSRKPNESARDTVIAPYLLIAAALK